MSTTGSIRQFQVDAFTSAPFSGNPAAVCPLDSWLDDTLMQAIAAENNLSETAFFVPQGDDFALRWFTPVAEVDLCGHATLASAHVLFRHRGFAGESITFQTRSGELRVSRSDTGYSMDFPAVASKFSVIRDDLERALGKRPKAVYSGKDLVALYGREAEVRDLAPDMAALKQLETRGIIVTAPGEEVDFVSRFFAPRVGIDEDPVTGSAHCALAPIWAKQLGRDTLTARQLSPRGGELTCKLQGERVLLTGEAVTFMEGVIFL